MNWKELGKDVGLGRAESMKSCQSSWQVRWNIMAGGHIRQIAYLMVSEQREIKGKGTA